MFLGVNWCFWFDYVLVDNNNGGNNVIIMMVRIFSDLGILNFVFNIIIGNNWKSIEIDFFVDNNMKVCLGFW